MERFYKTPDEIEAIVAAFVAKTLPKQHWTHAAHLTAAVWHVKSHGFETALEMIKTRIPEYNIAVGTQNTPTGGYHETMTVFWMKVTDFFVRRNEGQTILDTCNALLASPLSARELPFNFYERETILSPYARAVFVEPDKTLLSDGALNDLLEKK